MYIEPKPGGIEQPAVTERMPIWRATNGDELTLSTSLHLPWSPASPATPENSRVVVTLAEDRFDTRKLWEGTWYQGVMPVTTRPGLVTIMVPDETAYRLRRGSYAFSIAVSDKFGKHKTTELTGTLLIEYEPSSETHSIPYKLPDEPAY